MPSNPLFILAFLLAVIAVSEWLARRTWMRHLGVALLVIVLTAVATNLDVIPAYGTDTPVYDAIFTWIAPLGIFWLLLHIGGSVNFNAIAIEYGVIGVPSLYAGAAAVDNAMTTAWMIACVALPRLLAPLWGASAAVPATPVAAAKPLDEETETTSIYDLALVLALGLLAVVASGALAEGIERAFGVGIPGTLVLTVLALLLAVFGAARLFGFDPATAAVASQANIGGGTTALALARSLGRPELELPAILLGSIGTALGNFLGFTVAGLLG